MTYSMTMFTPYLNQHFTIDLTDGSKITLELSDIKSLSLTQQSTGRDAFALYLLDREHPTAFLEQHIYPLAHPELGTLALFMVPLGPKPDGMLYEIIFT